MSAPGATSERTCPAGTYQPNYAGTSCRKCLAGTFSALPASSACTPCAPGTAQPNTEASACIPCAYGQYAGAGATHCKKCPAGTLPAVGASTCTSSIPYGLGVLASAGPGSDSFTLALDGNGAPWIWGTFYALNGGFPYPSPVLLSSTTASGESVYTMAIPATPPGATVIAISAGQDCGVLLFSDTTAGFFGDFLVRNSVSTFLSSGYYITDGAGNVLTGIKQAAAPTYLGFFLLRNFGAMTGVVTYLIDPSSGLPGNVVDANNNVIDPLNPTQPLQGAVQIAQGWFLSCALMGPRYQQPNTVMCFSFVDPAFLGRKPILDTNVYPYGPSLVSIDGTSFLRATSVFVGQGHACATISGRAVPCWGDNTQGQVFGAAVNGITVSTTSIPSGYGSVYTATTTFPSSDVLSVQSVSCGAYHTCVLLTDTTNGAGVVRCWGQDGTNGPNAATSYTLNLNVLYSSGPLMGTALTGVTSISAGTWATCATLGSNEAVTCECLMVPM